MINTVVTKGTYFDYKNPGVKKSKVSDLVATIIHSNSNSVVIFSGTSSNSRGVSSPTYVHFP